jgi:hypothetical protein
MPEISHSSTNPEPTSLLSDPHEPEVRVPCLDDLMPDDLQLNDLVVVSGRLHTSRRKNTVLSCFLMETKSGPFDFVRAKLSI